MEQVINLKALTSPIEVKQRFDTILGLVYDQKGNVIKEEVVNMFNAFLDNIQNPSSPPISKFYTVMILKEITERKQTKILSLLSSSELFQQLYNIALNVDPKKPLNEKGREMFSKDPKYSNQFMVLVLECFLVWGQRFQTNKNKEPTKFLKTLNSLIENKVVLPKQAIYFKNLARKPLDMPKQQTLKPKNPVRDSVGSSSGVTPQGGSQKAVNIATDIRFAFNKIQGLIGVLQNADSLEGIEEQINKYHNVFSKYQKQYSDQDFSVRVLNEKEDIVQLFFKIKNFLDQEAQLFLEFNQKGDYFSLRQSLMLQYDKDFGDQQTKKSLPSRIKKESKYNSQSDISRPPISTKTMVPQPKIITKKQSKKQQLPMPPIRQNKILKNVVSNSVINDFFDKIKSRSKSQGLGFSLVKQSLQKQKKNIKAHPARGSRVTHQSKINPVNLASLVNSKKNSIFINPPNSKVLMTNYDGNFVTEDKQLGKILYQMKKEQGHRKQKISNFRDKGILYQNQHIQIGYKSQQIYQEIDEYNALLSIQLFIGNKTESQLTSFNLQFLGDQNTLLYSNPREVKKQIERDFQYRHELVIIPKKIPFHFMNMRVTYKYRESQVFTTVAIPNSILKFATYLKTDTAELNLLWQDATKLRTQDFKLSHKIQPNNLTKQIPQLTQLTKYQQFSKKGSTTDYRLTCQILLMNLYQGILRIHVRPDLRVVLQIGIIQASELSEEHFRFYLQTLQFILKQTQW